MVRQPTPLPNGTLHPKHSLQAIGLPFKRPRHQTQPLSIMKSSFSQQQFGQLAKDKPQLHAIVKDIRDKASKYCSNRLSDLKRQARAIQNEGKTRERGATLNFSERVTAVMNDLRDKCKTANARGDETADEKRLKEATISFYVKWNHSDAK